MNYLLDTHAFLWFVSGDPALGPQSNSLIEDVDSRIYISAASLWEMAIKVSIGKLIVPSPLESFIHLEIERHGIVMLGITTEHISQVASLAFPASRHRDPFDRMIVAQSICENFPIISSDRAFDNYPVQRLW